MAEFNAERYVEDVNKEVGALYLALDSKSSEGVEMGTRRFNDTYRRLHSEYRGKVIMTGGFDPNRCELTAALGKGYTGFVKVAEAELSKDGEVPYHRSLFVRRADGIISLADRQAEEEAPQTGSELFRVIRRKTGTTDGN